MGKRVWAQCAFGLCLFLISLSTSATTFANDVLGLQTLSRESRAGDAELVNLNPGIGSWYILKTGNTTYHLEWAGDSKASIELTSEDLQIKIDDRVIDSVPLASVRAATKQKVGYMVLSNSGLFLRQQQAGIHDDYQEWGANLAREYGFDGVVDFYKKTLKRKDHQTAEVEPSTEKYSVDPHAPSPALLAPGLSDIVISPPALGLQLQDGVTHVHPGEWYALAHQQGVYFSSLVPRMIDRSIFETSKNQVDPLSAEESSAPVVLVAFSLDQFTVGWSHGTSMPGVGWSTQFPEAINHNLPGPDGFANLNPLAMAGFMNPAYLPKLVATMCGGFQRHHGVIVSGPYGSKSSPTYYGFIQEGVVMSRMNVGLATFIMYKDGHIDMKSWTHQDDEQIQNIRYARQNGVPLVERGEDGQIEAGIVSRKYWASGNWSGSAERAGSAGGDLLTQRAAVCLAEHDGHRFMIYGYFRNATPSALARTFQAYHCDYGVHLDMNSANQGYLGLFSHAGSESFVEHPDSEMAGVDGTLTLGGEKIKVPRYVAAPSEVDFFYILRK